jgi:acetoin utilization deacetylase AcuC-like enzyme
MKAYYFDHFVLPLPSGHRFPMEKYSLLRAQVSQLEDVELVEAPLASDLDLGRAHDPTYIERVNSGGLSNSELREIGFPWSTLMVERSKRSAGATIQAISINRSGGS